ncbi:MAG: glucokinase, partial [Chlamydiia bacterium]|nr:glucokinase [Chlamydiia bacterium]
HEHSTKECQEEMLHSDPSRVVSAWGLEQKDRACTRALDWFLSLYGAEAGNLALKMLSFGGFYIAGGIAAHLVDRMASGDFLPSFRNKGRFGALLTSMPVWVVMDDNAASLMGAAIYAKERHES